MSGRRRTVLRALLGTPAALSAAGCTATTARPAGGGPLFPLSDHSNGERFFNVADRAAHGDTAAAQIILSRVWAPRRGRPTPLSLPAVRSAEDTAAAVGAVVAAVANGTLTAEEAQRVAAVLEVQRKAVETLDLERRIAALEASEESGR